MIKRKNFFWFFLLLLLISCGAHNQNQTIHYRPIPKDAPHGGDLAMVSGVPDPIEGFNRFSFYFTEKVFLWVLRPILKTYRFLIPRYLRERIVKFNHNLNYPTRFLNNLFQGKGEGVRVETRRFIINTTIGLGGFFDPARRFGLFPFEEDFGQTFSKWGMGPGFYFFIPILGPSTGRDALGEVFNSGTHPATYAGLIQPYLFINPGLRLNEQSFQVDALERLIDSQMDPYVLMRELWIFQRNMEILDYDLRKINDESNPLPTLGTLALRSSPQFYRKMKVRKIYIPKTGKKLPISIWMHRKRAPMVFIVPGLGAHRTTVLALFLAESVFKAGCHVVIMSNVFNWEFIKNASTLPAPGYPPLDIQEVSDVLNVMEKYVDGKWSTKITEKILLGYSLGGLQSLLMVAQETKGTINMPSFDRILVLGGPIDPLFGVRQLDSFYNAPLEWPENIRLQNIQHTLYKAAALLGGRAAQIPRIPFNQTESKYLIGLYNRFSLMDAMVAVHQYHISNPFKAFSSRFNRNDLYDEMSAFSYEEYYEYFVLPYVREKYDKKMNLNDLTRNSNIKTYGRIFQANPKIRMIISADDFLLTKNDVQWLSNVFGSRLKVFPTGGHFGNVYTREFVETFIHFIRSPIAESQNSSKN